MRTAADVVQIGRVPLPVPHLAGVGHEPHVHVVMLRKALDLGQHLTDVLCFAHEAGPLVIQLVVRINHQTSDAKPEHCGAGQVQHPLDGGQLVVLAPDQVEAVVQPLHAPLHVLGAHAGSRPRVVGDEEGYAKMLFQQLPRMIRHLLLHGAQGEAPAVQVRQVGEKRIDPLRLARVGHPRDDGQLPWHYLVKLIQGAPSSCDSQVSRLLHAVVIQDLVVEVRKTEQAADGVWLGGVQAVPQAVRAIRHQHVVGVLAEGNVSLLLRLGVAGVAISRLGADPRPPHPPAPLPAQPPGQLLCQHLAGGVIVGGNDYFRCLVQLASAVPEVAVLLVLVRRWKLPLLHFLGGTIGDRNDIGVPGLFQGELVHLALHDNDLRLPHNVVQPEQHLLRAVHLLELLVQAAILDVDELLVAHVWECDARGGGRIANLLLLFHNAVAMERRGTDAPAVEEIHHLLTEVMPFGVGPDGGRRLLKLAATETS
mmetsp:Transcript_9454/g.28453  ORF Transcript_9454/g.28453 Transcript_9454/m.28453 type:complete len:480 (+) Transcript_9454:491-1930(+)